MSAECVYEPIGPGRKPNEHRYRCVACGHERESRYPAYMLHRDCPKSESGKVNGNGKPGIGDMVEKALTAIGITEERVTRWLGRPCGCRQRKEKLNRLGRWAAAVLRGERPALPWHEPPNRKGSRE